MRLRDSELHGLPVFTAAGERLGTVAGVVLDVAAHAVAQYAVTRSRSLSDLLPGELLVAPSQVQRLDAEAMIVDDDVVTAVTAEKAVAMPRPVEAPLSGTAQMKG
jgi:sporulation protein YlmC with PRC-barrel domain